MKNFGNWLVLLWLSWSSALFASDWNTLQKKYAVVSWGKKEILLPALLSEVKSLPKAKILDDGCANGYDLEHFFKNFHSDIKSAFGVDPAADGILLASKREFIGRENVGFIKKNLEEKNLPFADGYFDIALSTNVIPTLGRYESILNLFKEHRRVVRKGGHLLVTYISEILARGRQANGNYKASQAILGSENLSPIKYHLQLRKTDNTWMEFDDHAWPTEYVKQALTEAGFDIITHKELKDASEGAKNTITPFEMLVVRAR